MSPYRTRRFTSNHIAVERACAQILEASNTRASLQRQGTSLAGLALRGQLPIAYILRALEATAIQAGLTEGEARDVLRRAVAHARAGVIRSPRRRAERVAA